ncbi:hypothetical protein ACFL3G_12895 [Planctomycetota bacterium]
MKARLSFSNLWKDLEVELSKETTIDFVPPEGMLFYIEPDPTEIFVEFALWYHDDGLLVISFKQIEYQSEEDFVDILRELIGSYGWNYMANKKAAEIIETILK